MIMSMVSFKSKMDMEYSHAVERQRMIMRLTQAIESAKKTYYVLAIFSAFCIIVNLASTTGTLHTILDYTVIIAGIFVFSICVRKSWNIWNTHNIAQKFYDNSQTFSQSVWGCSPAPTVYVVFDDTTDKYAIFLGEDEDFLGELDEDDETFQIIKFLSKS